MSETQSEIILERFNDFDAKAEDVEVERRNYLRSLGWNYTSNTPGSYWLFEKTLPDGRVVLCEAATAQRIEEWFASSDIEPEGENE